MKRNTWLEFVTLTYLGRKQEKAVAKPSLSGIGFYSIYEGLYVVKKNIAELGKFHRTLRDKRQDDRSTGASMKDKAWCLNENVIIGTYIQLAAANKVSFTIHTSKRPIG